MDENPTGAATPEQATTPDDDESPVPNRLSGMSDDADEEVATAFKPGLDPDTLNFGLDKPAPTVCQWCNTLLDDPTVSTCPHCGAALQPVEPDVEVPGLTTVTPEARAAQARAERKLVEVTQGRSLGRSLLAGGAAPPAAPGLLGSEDEAIQAGSFQPPDPQVQDVIRRMEIEALLARQNLAPLPDETVDETGAGDVTGAAGDETGSAGDELESATGEPEAAEEPADTSTTDAHAEGAAGDREQA